jgi:hypothetical protein
MKISSRPLCCDTGNRLTDDVWTTSIWRTEEADEPWTNERTKEPAAVRRGQTISLATLELLFFLFLSFIFARSPGGELAHFSSLWWCHYQLGENSLFFFYSHPLVDLRDRIFNLRQFFIFFSLWGVNNSICLNLNYSCSHPWMFHPPEKKQFFLRWNMFPNDFSPLERIKRKFHLGLFAA